MAQAMVNFRVDEADKKNMEAVCKDIGMSMSTALTIFVKKVGREHRIPFELVSDPFYSESNMQYLQRVISDIETGKAKLVEHDLVEV